MISLVPKSETGITTDYEQIPDDFILFTFEFVQFHQGGYLRFSQVYVITFFPAGFEVNLRKIYW